jgi:hypothetical protein
LDGAGELTKKLIGQIFPMNTLFHRVGMPGNRYQRLSVKRLREMQFQSKIPGEIQRSEFSPADI